MEIELVILAGLLLIGVLRVLRPERSVQVLYIPLPEREERTTGCLSATLLVAGVMLIAIVGYVVFGGL